MPSNSYFALNIISNQSKYNGVITMEHQDILLDKTSRKEKVDNHKFDKVV